MNTEQSIQRLSAIPRKKSSRLTLMCEQCGVTFTDQPSRHGRKYCSQACFGKARTASRYTLKPCPECGKLKKTRFEREPTRCEPGCRGKETSRIQKEKGHTPLLWVTDESRKKHRQNISRAKKGIACKDPKQKRNSPTHFRAVRGILRSPSNTTHPVCNLTKFVLENQHLFSEEDVLQRNPVDKPTYSCRATAGLLSILRGAVGSWKGWTVVSLTETFYNQGENLLSGEIRNK